MLSKVGLLGIVYQSIDNALALAKPFLSVLGCIVQVFITGYTKDTTLFKLPNTLTIRNERAMWADSKHTSRASKAKVSYLLRKRNHIKVEEA
jgi:hypothetical protein